MKLGIFILFSLFILNGFAIETKGDLKIETPLHTGFFGVSIVGLGDYEQKNDLTGNQVKGSFDRGFEIFGQSYIYTKTNKHAKGAVSMGLAAMYLSKDLPKGMVVNVGKVPADDWSLNILNGSGDLTFHYIPNHVFRYFIGLKLNYSIITSNEYSGDLGNVNADFAGTNGDYSIEYEGGMSFGIQTGFDIVVGPTFMQFRYQSFTIPYQFNEKAVTGGVESIGEKFEGDLKMSQVVVSLGVNF